jgi:hypothetical protein
LDGSASAIAKSAPGGLTFDRIMRSEDLLRWISDNQPAAACAFAHGWWNFAEFLQLLSNDFESFDFGVLTAYSMETPPPTTLITMPVVSARSQKLEIYFKESWVVEPDYTVTIKTKAPASFILLDILQPIDPNEKWLLKGFPSDCVHPPYCEGLYAFSGSIKNQHLLYALFHVLSHQVAGRVENYSNGRTTTGETL